MQIATKLSSGRVFFYQCIVISQYLPLPMDLHHRIQFKFMQFTYILLH